MSVVLYSLILILFAAQSTGSGLQPQRIFVNGVELHYVEQGHGEALIFIHGASGDYRSERIHPLLSVVFGFLGKAVSNFSYASHLVFLVR